MFRLTVENLEGRVLRELEVRAGQLTLGRGSDCDVKLPSASVSRQHARVTVGPSGVTFEDLGSSNGVLVDGRHIAGPTTVQAGTAAIGEFIVRVTQADPGWATAPTIEAPDETQPAHPDPGAGHSTLQLVRFGDDHDGERLALRTDDLTVGRVSRCDLQVVHPSVSRQHARIVRRGDQHILVDEGSSNGTRVNNSIVTQPTILREGDVVQIGDVWFAVAREAAAIDTQRLTTRWANAQEDAASPHRGLLVLITTMTFVVLVLGVLLLVLQTRMGDAPEPTPVAAAPSASPADMLLAEGRRLADQGRWAEALDRLQAAEAASDEPVDELAPLLERVRVEAEADTTWSACTRLLEDARQLEAAGSTGPAIDAYEAVRTCVVDLPADTETHARAHDVVDESVTPAVVRLLRYDGTVALQARDYERAVDALDRSIEVATAAAIEPPDGARDELRRALLLLGDQAFGDQAWDRALSAYDRADAIVPLDDAWSSRRAIAARNSGADGAP